MDFDTIKYKKNAMRSKISSRIVCTQCKKLFTFNFNGIAKWAFNNNLVTGKFS